MMSTGIESIAAIAQSTETTIADIGDIGAGKAIAESSFANLVSEGVAQVNDSLKASEAVLHALSLDKNVSTHEVMLIMEKAKMELKLMVEIRNKLLESYQEIMRMQV
ncbi:flagellar hook-basal body complex protein FliE [Paraneptunicella aestuarii]|uniref:flagellar hook-basal body complex protein FliE n=1 Tax=Paraneptunicella aestuarii TaxID=2831148 RepID=UPI001E40FB60|nr:flagellar hook-basal body complex protein FliE [Paraneptunicella aestuarii]UAA37593.1 flagellar hook-basal body complex protein FliE [Paraneptunicella aestuarii]